MSKDVLRVVLKTVINVDRKAFPDMSSRQIREIVREQFQYCLDDLYERISEQSEERIRK